MPNHLSIAEHELYASGLGLYVYATPRHQPLTEQTLKARQLAQVQVGSPSLYYHLLFEMNSPPAENALALVRFPMNLELGQLSVCDGYAELDWHSEDYQHVTSHVNPGQYDIVVSAHHAQRPRADWTLHFDLTPRTQAWADPEQDQRVELFFDVRWA